MVWSVAGLIVPVAQTSLEAEILVLRHQLNIQRRHFAEETELQCLGSPDLCWAVSLVGSHATLPELSGGSSLFTRPTELIICRMRRSRSIA